MEEVKTPTRDEIAEKDKWDLTRLFANVGKWNEDFAWLSADLSQDRGVERSLGESAKTFAEVSNLISRSI